MIILNYVVGDNGLVFLRWLGILNTIIPDPPIPFILVFVATVDVYQ